MPTARKKKAREQVQVELPPPLLARIEEFLQRRALLVVLGLILVGSIRIALTYTVFNHTSDEPAHIACGMQWLDQGIYDYEAQHPPLTRVMVALLPYLAGVHGNRQGDMTFEGNTILYGGGGAQYDWRLALSRAGNLPFFWLACWMTFLWGRRMAGETGAVVAVLIFSMTPTVLAHAGLSTTDMGVTACMAAAMYASLRLVEQPGMRTAAWFGLALGLMVLSKFSALVFYPAAMALALGVWLFWARPGLGEFFRRALRLLPWIALSAVLTFLLIWAGYRFSFGKTVWVPFPVPFPELYQGIKAVSDHNTGGHLSFLLGELRMDGWWYFFPVLIAVKLPLAMLGLMALGLWKRAARPASGWAFSIGVAICVAILGVGMAARINIGIRHILPMFPFLAIITAAGAMWLAAQGRTKTWARWTLAVALGWLCASSLAAHPDYLAYFNALAGDHPERIVVDSDLDWGQDIKRLGQRLRELNAPSVAFTPTITISLAAVGFPPHERSAPDAPYAGWNAVQITQWKLYRLGLQMNDPDSQTWPDVIPPAERIGKSILLYYIPPQAGAPAPPQAVAPAPPQAGAPAR
ncbi:MAG TPA: glycosyltransferase family 39 protein [Bryobacteraceae bacterium]|nr:glycosyltransferase family 39 protein [Bryobacteraceae bacterium]